jgi:hypothetical protein
LRAARNCPSSFAVAAIDMQVFQCKCHGVFAVARRICDITTASQFTKNAVIPQNFLFAALPPHAFQKKKNGMPAFAGMTVVFEEKTLNKNNRHAREGGHPIWFFTFHGMVRR